MNLNDDPLAVPSNLMENALKPLTQKTLSTGWGKFKTLLSTASEPLLRKDMGERYLNAGNLAGGCLIWFVGTAIALAIPSLRSAAGVFCELTSCYGLAHFFQFWGITVAIGGALIFLNYRFGNESIALMAKYRADGTAYHTMSRGILRWGDETAKVTLGIAVVLFLFDLPAGILFLASCAMSAKIAGEQQAAIYARYLDALDQKIEQEYLEDAILGK